MAKLNLPTMAALLSAAIPAVPATAAPLAKPAAFAVCGACHKVVAGEKATIGPNLWGVGGRKAGVAPGFAYSPAMTASKITWTREQLVSYLADPRKKVPGTKMIYAGQKDPKISGAIADYLLSLR